MDDISTDFNGVSATTSNYDGKSRLPSTRNNNRRCAESGEDDSISDGTPHTEDPNFASSTSSGGKSRPASLLPMVPKRALSKTVPPHDEVHSEVSLPHLY
jgi:hypothetical protein